MTDSPPPRPPEPEPELAPDYDDRGVPSLDHVRDKIDGRYGMSLGAAELAADTDEARSSDEQAAERIDRAKARLAEIRRSLGLR